MIDFANMVPLKYNGKVQDGYYVSTEGKIWSARELSPNASGSSPYMKVGISVDTKKTTVSVHRAVAESFDLAKPELIPEGVTKAEWDATPESVKKCLSNKSLDVHHKNHDKLDNRLENLEYMCSSKNRSIGNGSNK